MRPTPRRHGFEETLRNVAMLAAVLLAVHSLWPVWAPGVPRPWAGLIAEAGRLLDSHVGAPGRLPSLSSLHSTAPVAPAVDRRFSGCDEARAAGFSDIPRTDPSYREWMDGDGDGLACEPHRR